MKIALIGQDIPTLLPTLLTDLLFVGKQSAAVALEEKNAAMQDVLLCIQTGKTVDDENRMKFQTEEFYLKSEEELRQLFPGCEEALENTGRIADRCNP